MTRQSGWVKAFWAVGVLSGYFAKFPVCAYKGVTRQHGLMFSCPKLYFFHLSLLKYPNSAFRPQRVFVKMPLRGSLGDDTVEIPKKTRKSGQRQDKGIYFHKFSSR